jgi:hypothetical protein
MDKTVETFIGIAIVVVLCCICCYNLARSLQNPESLSTMQRVPNLERPPRSIPEPILQSVVLRNQGRQEHNHSSSYDQVIQRRIQQHESEVCRRISDPPSYDEVILNPLQLGGSEIRPHGSCSNNVRPYISPPPSYATANLNERNAVYYVNLRPEDSPDHCNPADQETNAIYFPSCPPQDETVPNQNVYVNLIVTI